MSSVGHFVKTIFGHHCVRIRILWTKPPPLPTFIFFSSRAASGVAHPKIRRTHIPQGKLKTMKLEHQELFHELCSPELKTLANTFAKYGYELRMAGGAVRDLILNKKPEDIDFATTATPDEMMEMFEKEGIRMINMKGEKHGTVTARINDKENFEVTTLRLDILTDGRHAEVEFTKNWQLDAGRRDLTINSMFLDLDGNVHDYFNGTDDLRNSRVKFVGEPAIRIQEDYLRILRYFRFYGRVAKTENEHDDKTLGAIKENVDGLGRISGERIWMELKKILVGNYAESMMLIMLDLGVGPYMGLPEIVNREEFKALFARLKQHKLEVNPITILSSLLKDQPEAEKLHARLKLSAFERDLSYFITLHRDQEPSANPLRNYQRMVLLSKSRSSEVWVVELLKYKGMIDILSKFKAWDPPKFPITGHMLMEKNVPAGKLMTLISTVLKEMWIESDFKVTPEDLLNQIPRLLDEHKAITKTKSK